MKLVKAFPTAMSLLLKDKINVILALTPIIIGIVIFYYIGAKFYDFASEWGQAKVGDLLQDSSYGSFVKFIFKILLWGTLIFIINFTFVLVVSIISSPFNSLLSHRIHKSLVKKEIETVALSMKRFISQFFSSILTEIKKVILIAVLALMAFVLNFLPILAPIAIILSALLISVQFLDYSWSRQEWKVSECITDIRKNFLSYSVSGLFFMGALTIPIVNLFIIAYGVSYYTVLWIENHHMRLID